MAAVIVLRLHLLPNPVARGTTAGADLMSLWTWEPSVLAGCAGLVILYVVSLKGRLATRSLFFFTGILVTLVALVSPLDMLSDEYLFSAHMLQHLLLVLVVPPLLLLGTPARLVDRLLRVPLLAGLERVLRRPGSAWAVGLLTLWAWHAPPLYNAALADEAVHVVEHLCFLVSATIFWWPVLSPREDSRMPSLAAALYLFTAAIANVLLGIYFTFAPPGLYPAYMHPDDAYGLLNTIRDQWGLSAATDQQLGGLIMWVPGGLVYLTAILAMLVRWYSATDADEDLLATGESRLAATLVEES